MSRLWEFEYSPKTWDDLIINDDLKDPLKKAIKERPNMLIYGPPGVGKGSYIDVLINENDIKTSTLKINASMEGGIDTIRQKVMPFAQAANFDMNTLKLVYLNEYDHPNLSTSQKSLRQLIEDTQKTTQWVLACNYVESVIPEIMSRCQCFHINNPPAKEIFQRCEYILQSEKVNYNKKTLLELVKRSYPDIRNTIITLRQNVINKNLKEKIEFTNADKTYEIVLSGIKSGDPEKVRKVLRSNTINYPKLYEFLYNKLMNEDEVFKDDAEAIVLIAEHAYRDVLVAIKEINFMHLIFLMMKKGII